MEVRLTKYRIKEGKSKRVDEWMDMLNENMDKVLIILKNENLYVETMFREKSSDGEFLYWYAIKGREVEVELTEEETNNKNEIIKKHMEFWEECIVPEEQPVINTEVVMIPKNIQEKMN
ncbi:DUF6176 family protein [Bacillus solimangrovi]|uniref:NIPSNAP domain-containing protein n=1 Tax=Bacillus solimangrovi TaxID=1305675 RepID=A0A1E5LHM2_9BACI|nr:DUF6176 family protein [Bacillus solimangrovi]OEH93567.1 hypothetical protein BFG57_00840 [Bacillus solimangrovi]